MNADTASSEGSVRWAGDAAGLSIGSLLISFQRYPSPASGLVLPMPRSHGALPVGQVEPRRFLLPVDRSEAFWIGLGSQGEDPVQVSIRVALDPAGCVDASGTGSSGRVWLTVPPRRFLPGLPGPDGWFHTFGRHVVGRPGASALLIAARRRSRPRAAIVALVDLQTYAKATGTPAPPPLDPAAAYQGYKLP